jgi:protein gp37
MADTAIEWTRRPGTRGKTWNPLGGCSDAGVDCANCYAKEMAARIPHMAYARGNQKLFEQYTGLTKKSERGRIQWTGIVRPFPERLAEPLSWKSPCTIFINSMSDLFHEVVPFEFIAAVYGVMAATPQHTYLGLTKRADRKRAFFEWMRTHFGGREGFMAIDNALRSGAESLALKSNRGNRVELVDAQKRSVRQSRWPLPNVWEGASCGVRAGLSRIDELRETPAPLRFLSLEPLLEDLGELDLTGIHWVIVGGESGHRARPCDVRWIRSIVEQCRVAGVPVFVKQLGARALDANDTNFDDAENMPGGPAPWPSEVATEDFWNQPTKRHQGAAVRFLLTDRKGGEPSEWPTDLRIRQFPEARP